MTPYHYSTSQNYACFFLEDDSSVADALLSVIRLYFREELETIETAKALQQARETLHIFQPDILIFDVIPF
jgi:hypothetical protein